MRSKEIWSWGFYDFANSSYSSIVPVLLFPLYYKAIVLSNSLNADLWWGITVGLSVLLAGIFSPFVGAFSDINCKRKASFIFFSIMAITGTILLGISGNLTPLAASALFILTNMSYGIALGLYDSLLGTISSKENLGSNSGLGYSLGYLGAIVGTILIYPFLSQGVESPEFWISFVVIGIFYFLFSIPSFIFVKESEFEHQTAFLKKSSLKSVFSTIRNWREYKQIFLFLAAFYFLTEGIVTMMYFVSLYSTTTLHLTATQVAIIFIVAQGIAVPSTFILGKYSDKVGYKRIILVSLLIFSIATLILSFARSIQAVYIAAILVGLVLGVSQSNARAWFTTLVPKEKRSELFGFNSLASKISATIGPPLFGVISVTTGSQRIAMLSIIIYFIAALVLFYKSKECR